MLHVPISGNVSHIHWRSDLVPFLCKHSVPETDYCLVCWRDLYSLVSSLSQRDCPFSPSQNCFLSIKKFDFHLFSRGFQFCSKYMSFMGLAVPGQMPCQLRRKDRTCTQHKTASLKAGLKTLRLV